jgi:hypothetical protein
VNPREYIPLKPGDQLKFGESTRVCIFESQKPYDPEEEMEERRKRILQERLAKAKAEAGEQEEEEGASWGFGEDAEEEEEEEEEEETEQRGKSGDASLLNVEAEKMALEDASKLNIDINVDHESNIMMNRKKKGRFGVNVWR